MQKTRIPADALVLVGDGEKAIFLRNKGTAEHVNLVTERILEQDNPSTHEQGTDRPGRYAGGGTPRSAMEQTDWHKLGEARFAVEIAAALYKRAHAGDYKDLIIVAPPVALGNLRKALHKEVADKVIAEIPKELTAHTVGDIEQHIAA